MYPPDDIPSRLQPLDFWKDWVLPRVADPGSIPQLQRLRLESGTRARNEAETRRFLASVVYQVPEAWLDDVLRVRMADLKRGR